MWTYIGVSALKETMLLRLSASLPGCVAMERGVAWGGARPQISGKIRAVEPFNAPAETMSAPPSERLTHLASLYGIQDRHQGHSGSIERVGAGTLVAILAAMGVKADTPAAVEHAIAQAQLRAWNAMIAPTTVVREGEPKDVWVHVAHGAPAHLHLEIEETGDKVFPVQLDRWVDPVELSGTLTGRATFQIPADLPVGYHTMVAQSGDVISTGTLIVVPQRVPEPPTRMWGVMAQLYSIHSAQSWGVGDFADLGDLCHLMARRLGADFALINPVHAVEPTAPLTPSPYLPTSRRFVSPWYLRVEQIREAAYLCAADREKVARLADAAAAATAPLAGKHAARLVDRDTAWTAKLAALRIVHAVPLPPARRDAFERFCAEQGKALDDFALWSVLYQEFGPAPWPAGYESPQSASSVATRRTHGAEILFHKWLQWVAFEQLSQAQHSALEAGMKLGIMQDLAVGVHPQGADVWALGELLAQGVSVGAPPDMYNQLGQDWSQPPWRPDALDATAYQAYRGMLRSMFQHCGAVRIDHVIGLFRLWWIPRGADPRFGAYVRYDHEALVGILCLEAQRAGVAVVGEDLGTFEHWVSDYLADRGLLGTAVLWFEKEWDGSVKAPEHYRRSALATVTTHDLPPTAGYLELEHVRLREELGLLTVPVAEETASAEAEIATVRAALIARGLLDPNGPVDLDDTIVALHRYLAMTPSLLQGVALVDLVGERRTQNQPGTDQEYPNWRVPLTDGTGSEVLLEDIADAPLAGRIAAAMNGPDRAW
ncbi:4-alpha-glucanotransferase [Rarobacter incanus]|uniref:4-alpha-glucanotransferase n=2 Tax=Rarobacter incanus TaxID=153494 RepID=A0A542SRZ5_9MICO|nr:4-alpha-glucanotransferase [Rarobacter incanus]